MHEERTELEQALVLAEALKKLGYEPKKIKVGSIEVELVAASGVAATEDKKPTARAAKSHSDYIALAREAEMQAQKGN